MVADRLSSAVVDLVSVALAERTDSALVLGSEAGQRTLLPRIQSFIDERLGDPELCPEMIAAAHHISTRYLYKLFRAEGCGVAEWIRGRRLERCRADLLDPAARGRTAHAIATRWGFTSPAHFTRIFRRAYGFPPGEFRIRNQG
ncbi:helix-turn-helix domain-containing protein [Nocardia sp. NPDC050406]|uniref:helix-turn-helix domain-containing protein n=1 Tax=Nocardia sp. NPDC050406 TaxID=3364318 RepID=UPI00379C2776